MAYNMVQTIAKGRPNMHKKRRVRISTQRQLTIPKEFYTAMNLEDEAMIEFTGKEMIIRSTELEVVDFSTDILKDLVAQGIAGDELIEEFTRIKASIPVALEAMKKEALRQRVITTGSLDEYLNSLDEDDEE